MNDTTLIESITLDIKQSKIKIVRYSLLRRSEPIGSVKWNTFLQLEKDLRRYVQDLEWTLDYFTENA